MIDITHIPFSRYGAYLAVTRDEGKDGTGDAKELVIQCARRRFEESPLFSLTFGGEAPEDFTCSAVPELLTVGNEMVQPLVLLCPGGWLLSERHHADGEEVHDLHVELGPMLQRSGHGGSRGPDDGEADRPAPVFRAVLPPNRAGRAS